MRYDLVIKEEAELDIFESYQWYESKRNGLGEEFLNVLEGYFKDIQQSPTHYQVRKKTGVIV